MSDTAHAIIGSVQAWEDTDPAATSVTDFSSFDAQRHSLLRDATGESWLAIGHVAQSTPVTHAGHQVEIAHRRCWSPWAFRPVALNAEVSSLGLGATASGIVLLLAGSRPYLDATDLVPAPSVYSLINPGQIALEATPALEIAGMTLVAPRLHRRIVSFHEASDWTSWRPSELSRRTRDALSAIDDLEGWLFRTRDDVCALANVSPRATQYWAKGKEPRPATVRRLLETRAFVSGLVRRFGRRGALDWLEQPLAEGGTRIELLATEDGFRMLTREAGASLFVNRPRRPVAGPLDEQTEPRSEAYDPSRFAGEPRRPRLTST